MNIYLYIRQKVYVTLFNKIRYFIIKIIKVFNVGYDSVGWVRDRSTRISRFGTFFMIIKWAVGFWVNGLFLSNHSELFFKKKKCFGWSRNYKICWNKNYFFLQVQKGLNKLTIFKVKEVMKINQFRNSVKEKVQTMWMALL